MFRIDKRETMELNYKDITGLLLFLFLAWACTDNQEEVSGSVEKQGIVVNLALTSMPLQGSSSVTRSVDKGMELLMGDTTYVSTRVVEESKINNLCIFQFEGTSKESSSATLISMTYVPDLNSTILPIVLKPFTHCFLYVCANMGDITEGYAVNSSTYQAILSSSFKVNGQEDFMSGCSDLLEADAVRGYIKVTLAHMLAKVSFICDLSALPSGEVFNITSAKLCNVPQTVEYISSGVNTTEVTSCMGTGTVNEVAKTTTYVWYMPENKRGDKADAKSWEERIEKNAPAYSSYIELIGDYVFSDGKGCEATYVIYLGNGTECTNYDVERNHCYKIISRIKGVNLADQRVTDDRYLSADGLANCYLASKDNHKYWFNGTVRGNGNMDDYAASQYPSQGVSLMPFMVSGAQNAVTIPAGEISEAILVWETTPGVVSDIVYDSDQGRVNFHTGTAKGNALIAVRDAGGTILWSWHIWRTDGVSLKDLDEKYSVKMQPYNGRIIYIVDRNLGSDFGGASPNYDDCYGGNALYYQFGRKDPFPVTYASTGVHTQFETAPALSSTALEQSIKNPYLYYLDDGEPYNWFSSAFLNTNEWKLSNCLWGDNSQDDIILDQSPWDGKKTIYDPSPAGWRVAPADVWTGIFKSNAQSFEVNYISEIYNASFSDGYILYSKVDSSKSIYLPVSGFFDIKVGTSVVYSGEYGYVWMSSPGGPGSLYGTQIRINNGGFVYGRPYRSYGFPIRCAKE